MQGRNVWVLGGYQTDFARNLAREGKDFADLTCEVVDATLESSGARADRRSARCTSATPSASCSPARPTSARCRRPSATELWGLPASRHEAACASGSVALLAAIADLEAGNYDVRAGRRRRAGAQRERRRRRRPPRRRRLDRPRGPGRQVHVAVHVRPGRRRVRAPLRPRRRAPARRSRDQLRQRQAQPQRADPRLGRPRPAAHGADDAPTRAIEGRVRRFDCGQVTDGGAGVVLVTDEYLRATTRRSKPMARGCSAGATAPPASALRRRSWPATPTTPTSCRTCAA